MLSRAILQGAFAAQVQMRGTPPLGHGEAQQAQREEPTDLTARSSSHRPCPRCGSTRVHRSRRRGVIEHVFGLAGLTIRRCHACGLRFTRLGDSVILPEDVGRVLRRLGQLALAVAGASLVLGLMVWFAARQAAQ